MPHTSDIIIVGAGPAGLSLCRSLADSGLRITLIDPHTAEELEDAPFDGREIALTHPSKQILEDLDIWQRFPQAEIYPLREAKVINGSSDYLLHFPLPATNSTGQAIDTLGYLVSNCHIRRGAYAATQNQDNIDWQLGQKVTTVQSEADAATVTTDAGNTFQAPLLVAADSRFSSIRRQMGIATDMNDYGRTVLVFRLKHELSNDHSAFECFFYGSTLALLPLTDTMTNCVVTIDTRKRHLLDNMTDEQLAAHIEAEVNHRFGKMTMASPRNAYPLIGVHAKRFYAPRCALIGDAACGTHPVTAHGFNLGLKGQAILSHLILRQSAQGKDIGAQPLLADYNRQHQKNTLPIYYGTNFIVNLFTSETPTARALRMGVIRVSNHLAPLKTLITRQLTG